MMEKHKIQIGVMGSWRSKLPQKSFDLAEEMGEEIAKADCILITGGSTGVMEHSMKGCKKANGTTIGIIASSDYRKYEYLGRYIDVKINTGMGENGRIPILINSCDGVIAIGGGVGTLTEVACAYHQGKPIVIMQGSGNVSDKVKLLLDEEGYLDSKKLVKIQFAKTAKEAVSKLILAISNGEGKNSHSWGPEHCKRS
jgi:uncharacterized protein (TIGR00725 family)